MRTDSIIIFPRPIGSKTREKTRNPIKGNMLEEKDLLFEALVVPLKSRMIRSIWRIVRDSALTEDILQDALAVIWRNLSRIQNHPNPKALILKICLDSAYDALRRQKKHSRYQSPGIQQQLLIETKTAGTNPFESKEIEAEILDAISRLPLKQARAVIMRIVWEWPYDEIAEVLECKKETVRVQVLKARRRLSQRLSHLNPAIPKENVR